MGGASWVLTHIKGIIDIKGVLLKKKKKKNLVGRTCFSRHREKKQKSS
jgi:hypothetical protein